MSIIRGNVHATAWGTHQLRPADRKVDFGAAKEPQSS